MTIVNNWVIALLNTRGFTNHAQARYMFEAEPSTAMNNLFRL